MHETQGRLGSAASGARLTTLWLEKGLGAFVLCFMDTAVEARSLP